MKPRATPNITQHSRPNSTQANLSETLPAGRVTKMDHKREPMPKGSKSIEKDQFLDAFCAQTGPSLDALLPTELRTVSISWPTYIFDAATVISIALITPCQDSSAQESLRLLRLLHPYGKCILICMLEGDIYIIVADPRLLQGERIKKEMNKSKKENKNKSNNGTKRHKNNKENKRKKQEDAEEVEEKNTNKKSKNKRRRRRRKKKESQYKNKNQHREPVQHVSKNENKSKSNKRWRSSKKKKKKKKKEKEKQKKNTLCRMHPPVRSFFFKHRTTASAVSTPPGSLRIFLKNCSLP